MLPEPSLPVGMFLVSPPALCSPNLKAQLLWGCGGIVERAKCLEEFLPGVGGWWHPEPCERERMCLLFGGKGDNREKRATCWPEFWSSSVFALNWKHTHLSYCQLQTKIDSTSLNQNNLYLPWWIISVKAVSRLRILLKDGIEAKLWKFVSWIKQNRNLLKLLYSKT